MDEDKEGDGQFVQQKIENLNDTKSVIDSVYL
jgi:hypothetical protein